MMEQAQISIKHTSIKHAQTLGMTEQTHQKLQTILKINISADQPQWDQYGNISVMAHNTTYHDFLKCAAREVFHRRTPHNALDLKLANLIPVTNQPTDISNILDEVNKKYKRSVHKIVTADQK